MDAQFRPILVRATGPVLDVVLALLVMTIVVISVLTLFESGTQDGLARAYARQLHLTQEEACPTAFGKPFWFTCAIEVRRLHAGAR